MNAVASSTAEQLTSQPPAISSKLDSLLSLPVGEREKLLLSLSDEEAAALLYTWEVWARPNQLEPEGDWTTWLILAGRGFGKTRTGSETIIKWVRSGTCSRIALVAEDSADARDVMVEGESGILACSPPDFVPKYEPSKRRLTWPNGAIATLYSAEDYDSLRGPQFDGAWCDELCKWRYAVEAWDNLQFGLRLGQHPRQIVTTTPKPIKLLKDILLRDDTFLTKGSTYDNLDNLAAPFRKAVVAKYEGTRIGRQELNAEILEDIPGAMWSRASLDANRVLPADPALPIEMPEFARIVVAVDPATTVNEESDETGIIVAGIDYDGHGYVIADVSIKGSPDEWGNAVVKAYDDFEANEIVYESNQGGDMVKHTIITCAMAMKAKGERRGDFVPLRSVHASRGKATRAEPVSALYEQNRISHIGTFVQLEDQMCEFTSDFNPRSMKYSPDRVDAMVWAFTHLMVDGTANSGLMDYYREENDRIKNRVAAGGMKLPTDAMVLLVAPADVNTAYGRGGDRYTVDADGNMLVKEADVKTLLGAGFMRALENA